MKIFGTTIALVIFLILMLGILYISGVFNKEKPEGQEGENGERNLTATEAVTCALQLYQEKEEEGVVFSSQCLGTCGNYAVDIVSVPRNDEDDLEENQCKEYREGKVSRFIELDKAGNIVRIG